MSDLVKKLHELIMPLDAHQARHGLVLRTARGLEGYMDIGGDKYAVVPEIISTLRAAAERIEALEAALKPFAEAAADAAFADHPGFPQDGIAPTRYEDPMRLYILAFSGEDWELRTDDYAFTLGDLRKARAALEPGK